MTLKFDGWPWKTIGHLFYTTSTIVHHFKAMGEFKLELRSGNNHFVSKSAIFSPMWPWNLMDDLSLKKYMAPLLCCFKLCASFHSHWWIQTRVTVRKRANWVKIDVFCCPVWPSNLKNGLKNNRASLLCYFKLCASFRSHQWIQTWVTVRKRLIWVKIDDFFFSRVILKFAGSPWKTIGHLF